MTGPSDDGRTPDGDPPAEWLASMEVACRKAEDELLRVGVSWEDVALLLGMDTTADRNDGGEHSPPNVGLDVELLLRVLMTPV